MACQRWRRPASARVTHVVGPAQCAHCRTIFSYRIAWRHLERGLEEMACPACGASASELEIWADCATAEIAFS
jgi:hypothetical protein